jgi:hypothetical protein
MPSCELKFTTAVRKNPNSKIQDPVLTSAFTKSISYHVPISYKQLPLISVILKKYPILYTLGVLYKAKERNLMWSYLSVYPSVKCNVKSSLCLTN